MDLGIAGEKALVVGASEGIGYESAKGLLEALKSSSARVTPPSSKPRR